MSRVAGKILFAALILRFAAAVVLVGAIVFGIYTAFSGAVLTGLLWIGGAGIIGFIGKIIFDFFFLTVGTMVASTTPR